MKKIVAQSIYYGWPFVAGYVCCGLVLQGKYGGDWDYFGAILALGFVTLCLAVALNILYLMCSLLEWCESVLENEPLPEGWTFVPSHDIKGPQGFSDVVVPECYIHEDGRVVYNEEEIYAKENTEN